MLRVKYIINLLIVFLLLLTVAINRDGQVFGTAVSEWINPQSENSIPIEWLADDGVRVISSQRIAQGISGYGGVTPVRIHLRDGKIKRIELLENRENSEFMNSVIDAKLLHFWYGLTPQQALQLNVDAVSGATLTSKALIQTIEKTLEYASQVAPKVIEKKIPLNSLVGLAIIVLGILVSIYANSKWWRFLQLCLNVVVLGFWCGSFLSLSLLVNWISGGVNWIVAIVPLILLIVAVTMPMFGKRGHYCSWHCPMGALQELLGQVVKPKLTLSYLMLKYLNYLRKLILCALLFSMWIGVGFELMGYEVFSAFLFRQASSVVLAMGSFFILLSCFVSRPYCRFVCPTGSLLKYSQQTN
jgi:hypothetical protein